MNTNMRKLNTNDILLYDQVRKEAYVIASTPSLDRSLPDRELVKKAGELVAAGRGIRLSTAQLHHLKQATGHIEFLT